MFGIEGPARILAVHCPQGGLSSDGLIAPTVVEVSDSEGGSPRAEEGVGQNCAPLTPSDRAPARPMQLIHLSTEARGEV